ncbi:MAG: undecaprenyl-diphosphate phosphatase [Candidatus Neomarinimicrobiota bacterium]|nr:undecaprenyl-diphosphate phosphatase [Candidatus Neomarinimicrobiota bacterium]
MSAVDAFFLGVIQGTTEFLPVSSSGHLVLLANWLNADLPGLTFEVVVHLGTLLSILIIFRNDLKSILRRVVREKQFEEIIAIAIATVPPALIGLFFKSDIELAFSTVSVVGWCLLVTGIILGSTSWVTPSQSSDITLMTAFFIGVAQTAALLPGISRSGVTIAAALWLGISGRMAGRFSFLIAIPVLFGSGLLMLPDILAIGGNEVSGTALSVAFASSFVIGLGTLRILLGILESGKLYLFSGYCILVGIIAVSGIIS